MTPKTVSEWMATPPTSAFVIQVAVTQVPDLPGPHAIEFESSHGFFACLLVSGVGVYHQIVNRERFPGITSVRAVCQAGVRHSLSIYNFPQPW